MIKKYKNDKNLKQIVKKLYKMIKIKKQIKTDQENKAYHSMEEANPKTNLRIKRTTSDVMWLYTIFWNIISIQSCCRFVRVSQVELGLYCIHRVQVGTKIGPKIGLKNWPKNRKKFSNFTPKYLKN